MFKRLQSLFLTLILSQVSFAELDYKSIECALIYRIIHFTELPKAKKPYNVCIDAPTDVFLIFKNQLLGKKINENILTVLRVTNENVNTCDVLYVGKNNLIEDLKVLKLIKEKNLIVFTSNPNWKEFSVVLFSVKNGKIVFKIHKSLIDKTKINMSSKVLRLASEVY